MFIINRVKRQSIEQGEIPANNISDKGLISKTYNEFLKFSDRKNPNKKCAKDLKRHVSREDIQNTNKHMKI